MRILLVILLLVALLLLTPLRFIVEYSENGFSVVFKVLFFKVRLPRNKKEKKTIKTEKKKNIKEQREGKKPGELLKLTDVLSPAFDALGRLVHMLSVNNLVLDVKIASSDPFRTAMMYGGAATCVGLLFPMIKNTLKIKNKHISVNADFESKEALVYMYANISIMLCQLFVIAICFLYKYLKRKKQK